MLPVVRGECGLGVGLKVELVGLERHEVVEAIAAVNVHVPADRPKAVGRVLVALVGDVVAEAPEVPVRRNLVLLVPSRAALYPVAVVVAPEVVDVRALGMDEVAELAEAAEVERKHLDFAVAAVLELHAVALEPLGSLDELPALIDGKRGRNLDRDVLAGVHRVERNRNVKLPRRRVVDEIDVLVVAELLPLLGAASVDLRRGTARLLDCRERTLDAHGVQVADRGYLAAGNRVEAGDAGLATTETDDADSQLLERLVGVGRHRPAFAEAEALCRGASDDSCRRAHPRRTLDEIPAICIHSKCPPFLTEDIIP